MIYEFLAEHTYITYCIISALVMLVLCLITRIYTSRYCDISSLAYSIHEAAPAIFFILFVICAIIGLFLPLKI